MPLIDSALIEKVRIIGFSFRDASDICAEYEEKKVVDSLKLLKKRMSAKNSTPLDSPAAYFRWCLKQNTDSAITDIDIEDQETKVLEPKAALGPIPPSTLEKFLTFRSKDAYKLFDQKDESVQQTLFERFKEANEGRGIKFKEKVHSPVVRSMFSMWYANELWGPPTDESVERFVQEFEIGKEE